MNINFADLIIMNENKEQKDPNSEEKTDKELRKEVEIARGTYATLGDRLDGLKFSLLHLETKLDPIDCGTF